MSVRVLEGDCMSLMPTLTAGSIDACITDPPYGLEFMGKGWDSFRQGPTGGAGFGEVRMADGAIRLPSPNYTGSPNPICTNCGGSQRGKDRKGFRRCVCDAPAFPNTRRKQMHAFQAWCETWAVEVLRVMRPGAYLLAFGGTRTYHRLTCAIEDAGFEICDCLSWLYGSGFPKHQSKLKPAWEPIVMARKPAPRATLLNIDACRIGLTKDVPASPPKRGGSFASGGWNGNVDGASGLDPSVGRWPANVVLDEEAALALDQQSGERPTSNGALKRNASIGYGGSGSTGDGFGYGDCGGASRFFYTAKASRSERESGLDGAARRPGGSHRHGQSSIGSKDGRDKPVGNFHPTVKPVDLMRWLVRLVTPPNGLVLDPFAGSGTTGVAAVLEDRRFVGIEREAEYVAIAEARIRRAAEQGSLFREVTDVA